MSSPAKAAAAVQNNILLVQYSPTGNGIGDLYAIMLSDLKQPIPFQIQRQAPSLQASKGPLVSMTLASLIPPPSGSNPTKPGTSPPAPPGTSSGSVDGSGSSPAAAAVVAAPPFLDAVLSVNSVNATPQAWHVKAPGRGVPPGATHSNPLAPIWNASVLSPSFFPGTMSISVGTYTPQKSENRGILSILQLYGQSFRMIKLEYAPSSGNAGSPTSSSTQAPPSASPSSPLGGSDGNNSTTRQSAAWKQSWSGQEVVPSMANAARQPSLSFHPITVPPSARGGGYSEAVAGECLGNVGGWCVHFLLNPPVADKPPKEEMYGFVAPSPCFTSTSNEMIAVAGNQVYVNKFAEAVGKWDLVTPVNVAPNFQGPAVACTTTNNVVIAIVPDSNVQAQPAVHFFDLNTFSWAKAQLVQAPPGTFSDAPPIPPSPGNSSRPDKGGPNERGPDPSTTGPSSANATNSRAALIGGIVGGIVVLGVLIFVVFFFRRRRSSKQKGQNQGGFALKSLDGDDGLHKMQRMHDGERSGRSDGRRLEANGYREKAWPSAGNPHEMISPQAQATTRPRRNNPHAMAYPPTFNQHEIALSQAGSPQTIQSWIIDSQDMNWSPANDYRRTAASSRADSPRKTTRSRADSPRKTTRSRAESPRKTTRSRVNSPQEVSRAMIPVVHRTNDPQYDPNQQL